ncbi:MAG: TonB-dependent receptor plug domain-containing protein [Pseudomonadota bacterium]
MKTNCNFRAVTQPFASILIIASATLSNASLASDSLELDPIVVEADPEVVTEDSDSYTAERATVGFKQPIDTSRIPQTINVITRQRLDDANANSIEEAAYLVPNLSEATGNGFSGSLYSRGHEVFTYNVDGAPRPFLSLYGTAPDLSFFDRVEILSGPSGVFQGTGEPVGTINFVRKRAKAEFDAEASITAGSFSTQRVEGDITGGNESGSIRGRLIAYDESQDASYDYGEQDRDGVSGTVEFDVGDAGTISVGTIVENRDTTAHSGLPTFIDGELLDVDPETYIGAPWNSNEGDTQESYVEYEHEFDNGGVLKIAGRVYDRDTDIKSALATTGVDPVTGEFSMITFARNFEETTDYLDVNFTAPFLF